MVEEEIDQIIDFLNDKSEPMAVPKSDVSVKAKEETKTSNT